MAFSHTESISGTEHMKNSEPKSCDPYVDSLIRNADAKESLSVILCNCRRIKGDRSGGHRTR